MIVDIFSRVIYVYKKRFERIHTRYLTVVNTGKVEKGPQGFKICFKQSLIPLVTNFTWRYYEKITIIFYNK